MTTKWQDLSVNSHFLTAVAVKDALAHGDFADAKAGIEELIDALSRADKRAVRSHLERLMAHIIKWHSQPDFRSTSWRVSINHSRSEIADIREETPSITRQVIESYWERIFRRASEMAEAEMNRTSVVEALTWKQVFEDEYSLADDFKESE
jgi:Domain of unknown function DUF29